MLLFYKKREIVQKGSFGTQAARLQVLVKRTSRPHSTFLDNPYKIPYFNWSRMTPSFASASALAASLTPSS